MHQFIEFGDDLPCHDPETMDDWFIDPGVAKGSPDGRARRRAIQKCYFDCPMKARLLCLDEGLKPENIPWGIWGGYTESERRDIVMQIHERDKKHPNSKRLARAILSQEKREALQPE